MRKLIHVSDLHFGRHEPALAEALLRAIDESRPDLVVVSGDLTQRARHEQFAAAGAFLARIRAPALVVPGNHDVPLWNPVRRFVRPLARYRRYVSSVREPAWCDEEIAVLGLDTARRFPFTNGRISAEQMTRVRRFFATSDRPIKILVTHHPLTLPAGADAARFDPVGRARAALDAIAAAGVHLMLSGHFHASASGAAAHAVEVTGPAHSVLVVHAGTAISTRTRDEANAWNLLCVEKEAVEVAVMTASGDRFAETRRDRYRWRGGAWQAE